MLWFAGILLYVASFLGSMSIGLYIFVFPIVLWTFAIASTFRLIGNSFSKALFIGIGVLLWIVSITLVDDYWLFFPFHWLLG